MVNVGLPAVAVDGLRLVSTGPETTAMLQTAVVVSGPSAALDESTTFAVKVLVPAAVGLPEVAPLELLSVSPGGRAPLAIEYAYGGTPPAPVSAEL